MSFSTAAILIIGNEILSGETQDANISFIGQRLSAKGIKLAEVRIVRDEEGAIVAALNALRAAYTYVFTTGGIGPTHDDITADSIAAAFGLPNDIHEDTRIKMEAFYKSRGSEINAARLRMARMPKGATPIISEASVAPGFNIENVYVMAGVPRIMQAQFLNVEPSLKAGPPVLSRKVQCNQKEGDIADDLTAIQKKYPDIDIGSYPHMERNPSLSLVLRGRDAKTLDQAALDVAEMVKSKGETPILDAIIDAA